MKRVISFLIICLSFLFFTPAVFAHEAYVLTRQEFLQGLSQNTPNPFAGLIDPAYMQASIIITLCVMFVFTLAILWATTPVASFLDKVIKKAQVIGPFTIRLAISSSFFFAAQINTILGPELSLQTIPGGMVIRFLLYTLALMIFFGVFVELAALIGLLIFFYISQFYGLYLLTYVNYVGELIVLFLFGSRVFSFDMMFFGQKLWSKSLEKCKQFETPIIRILYGIALIYAGYTIKFQHQTLSIAVYNQYHLKDFFHASGQFVASGAGLSEILIGLFILLGFAQRLTIIISFIFITLSLLYFREMLWPHVMLYGISFSLFINSSDELTIDHYLIPWVRGVIRRVIGK